MEQTIVYNSILVNNDYFVKQEAHIHALMEEFGLTEQHAQQWAEREAAQLNLY